MLSIDAPVGTAISFSFAMTGNDIDAGEKEDCWSCPIAQCINRTLPDYESEVDGNLINLYELQYEEDGRPYQGDLVFQAKTPIVCQEFISEFDDWYDDAEPAYEPITFTLELVRQA